MRNPFAFWTSTTPPASRDRAAARHGVLFGNALVLLAGAGLAIPFALVGFAFGRFALLAGAVAVAGLAALAVLEHLRERHEEGLALQVATIGAAGLLLALADPTALDFGLGIALLAPVYASVFSQSRLRALAWAAPALTLVVGVATAEHAGWAGMEPFALLAAGAAATVAMLTARALNAPAASGLPSQGQALAALAEGITGGVVRYGADGAPGFVSRSASTLLGCQRFELDGGGLFERVHVMDRPAYRKAISDVANSRRPETVEIRMRRDHAGQRAAGDYLWVELSLAPLPAEGEGAREVLGVFRDIGARKDAEAELKRARREAEEASQAKSRFLATIGHELRTPLNSIVGFSDMMAEGIGGTLSPTHREYAGHIRQSGHHLLDVVNMLLDMSKIEAGKFEVHTELFAPQSLVEPCLQMVEKLGRDRGIVIETSVPERLPQIVGDERACRQILINLLSNAVKFSHDGGRVTLAMKRQGRMLAISVSDEGIGMRPETVRRIGEPFLQAQDGLTRRYEGTGLGLSIVKGLVALHGGRISFASEPGAGTTVSVLLPIDGPSLETEGAGTIEPLHKDKRHSDEQKWLEDEKRSAAR